MKRLIILLILVLGVWSVTAQTGTEPEPGDPPVAALITISAPDENGIVTISGAAGSVFPAAQVAIKNLYTEEVVYTTAGFTGTFTAQIYGPGITPFWISPAQSIPSNLRNQPGVLPGGPGTIVYGTALQPRSQATITQLIIDGDLEDWEAYADANLRGDLFALTNTESFYLAARKTILQGSQWVIVFSIDSTKYELVIDPFVPQAALIREVEPNIEDLGTLAVYVANTPETIEVRIPLNSLDPLIETATLEQAFIRTGEDVEDVDTIQVAIPAYDEVDGIVYDGGRMQGDFTRFTVAGPLAQGASTWTATGRINQLTFEPGDTVSLELDLTLNVPDLAASQVGLSLIGELSLQPVTVGENGEQNIPALHTNNGWSNVMTPSRLAINNLRGDVVLGQATVPAAQLIRKGDNVLAGMRFTLTLPRTLPSGLYIPTFTGYAQIGDGNLFRWVDNGAFGAGDGVSRLPLTRLPIVLNIGDIASPRLTWTLFYDTPSDGSRGIIAQQDQQYVALSNRVRFNSQTYILPPGEYSIEPYLLNQMPNDYDTTTAPLLPLLFPGGRVKATITRPDGDVDDLPDAAIVQNRLSTDAIDERDRFGAQTPLDTYQLQTATQMYNAYPFDQYGDYAIRLTGNVEDIYGNRYQSGGDYHLLIAEMLDLTPGVLSGSPFFVGDLVFIGGRVAPAFPAEVEVTVRLFPLDGDVIEQTFTGTADSYGFFALGDYVFEEPGEYLIDYEARYTDNQGRLWAASLRSAGVVAQPQTSLIAHGKRGIDGFVSEYRPAWFNTAQYPPPESLSNAVPRPNMPYFIGDVAYIQDSRDSGLYTSLTVQDTTGRYRDWLLGTVDPNYISYPYRLSLSRLSAIDELPFMPVLGGGATTFEPALLSDFIVNQAYAYISVTRPDITLRQFVLGRDDEGINLYFDGDDPFNGQIGAGANGLREGDYAFVFGGGVVHNAEAGIREVVPYASFMTVVDEDTPAGVYPPYRGAAGGAHAGALIIADDTEFDIFFHPTAVRPGQVMMLGADLVFAGQVAPTLRSYVEIEVTSPSGQVYTQSGYTNNLGYYYVPDTITLNESGRWQVEIVTLPAGVTSAGIPLEPLPRGGVLGATNNLFDVYVVPEDAQTLELTSGGGDIERAYGAGTAFNLTWQIPPDWTGVRAYHTVSTPSYVLSDGTLQ
ncbi:MAG: hypothetical protein CUN56_08310, partial [Phototrophicales bacterium]